MAKSANRSARLSKKCRGREEEGVKRVVFISMGHDPPEGGFECIPKGNGGKKGE